jgi:hypothetical protein
MTEGKLNRNLFLSKKERSARNVSRSLEPRTARSLSAKIGTTPEKHPSCGSLFTPQDGWAPPNRPISRTNPTQHVRPARLESSSAKGNGTGKTLKKGKGFPGDIITNPTTSRELGPNRASNGHDLTQAEEPMSDRSMMMEDWEIHKGLIPHAKRETGNTAFAFSGAYLLGNPVSVTEGVTIRTVTIRSGDVWQWDFSESSNILTCVLSRGKLSIMVDQEEAFSVGMGSGFVIKPGMAGKALNKCYEVAVILVHEIECQGS